MNKRLIAPAAALLLSACVTTAPKQHYRPAPEADPLVFTGQFDDFSMDLNISVNGSSIIQEKMPDDADKAEFSGLHAGRIINAYCTKNSTGEFTYQLNCMMLVDDKRAATLTF